MSSDPTIATQVDDEARGERRWVRFACPHCLKHLKADATPPGGAAREFTCSRCGGRVVLPARPRGPGDSGSGRPARPVIAREPDTLGDAVTPAAPTVPVVPIVPAMPVVPVPPEPAFASPHPPVAPGPGYAPGPAIAASPPPDPMAALARRAQAARDASPARRPHVPHHRRRTPWWMVIAHVSIPIGTVYALWWLHANGYLPAFDGPSTVTIVRPAPPSPPPSSPSATTPAAPAGPDVAGTPPAEPR